MNIYIQILIESLIVFTAVFLLNYFLFVRKNKKLKKNDMPLELIYLANIYSIDPKKINYRKFQYAYSLINSFIITTTYLLVIYLIKSMIIKKTNEVISIGFPFTYFSFRRETALWLLRITQAALPSTVIR